MAWVADPEFSEDAKGEHVAKLFPEDEPRMAEAEAQLLAEVKARYEADTVKGPLSLWYNPWEHSIGMQSGWRWPLNDRPYRYRLAEPTDAMADIDIGVSERVVDLIESLEPGVHQYLPVEVYHPYGSLFERRWLLNICSRLDTFAAEHSNIVVSPHGRYSIGKDPFQVSAWAAKASGHALWCEYRVPLRMASETFREEANRKNIHGFAFKRHVSEI
jgi:hypothetical protein